MSARADKAQAEGAQSGQKGQQDPGYTPGQVQVKLHASWAEYVRGLGGSEASAGQQGESQRVGDAEQRVGDAEQRVGDAAAGPAVGDGRAPLSQNPDPTTVHGGQNYEPQYKKFEEPVFKGTPRHTDANQGYLGDCYLIAAMASVAQQRPDLIEQMIEDHGDGTVTVTMFKVGGALAAPGQGSPVKVRITTELPTQDGRNPAYARGAARQLWPALLEKAYIAINLGGTYQAANTGGIIGHALQAILGQPADAWPTTSKPAKVLVADLEKLLGAGKPVCAGSLGKDAYEKDEALADLADAKHVVPSHAYVVVKVDAQAGTLELYNPWGTKHPARLSGEEFQKLYTWVYQGNPPAPKS